MRRSRVALLLTLSMIVSTGGEGFSEAVRPAPDILFPVYGGKTRQLSSFRGQPLILLLAETPKEGPFRSQLKELENSFDRLAVRNAVVAAGFSRGDFEPVRTNLPLVTLPHSAGACAAFQLKGNFAIVLIGPDGNIDYQTSKVLNINRIFEVMQNSYEIRKPSHR